MQLDDNEIWDRVRSLKGKILYTYVENEPNTIVDVENTGSPTDKVSIKERVTCPVREDILGAYRLLELQGKIQRSTDLAWLATPEKKTSSIVFRIVGEVAGDSAILAKRRPEVLKLK